MIAAYIATHSRGRISVHALLKKACKLIGRVKSMKKKLSRNWYKLTFFLNEEFAIPIVDEESHPRRTSYHNNVATVCTTPLTLKIDCMKCVTRRSVVKELVDSYKKLKIIQHQCEETLKRVQDERHKEKHQKIDQRE